MTTTTTSDKSFSRSGPSMDMMRQLVPLAGAKVSGGVKPGDLRWLHPAVDFVWPTATGEKVYMDPYQFLAMYRECATQNYFDFVSNVTAAKTRAA